MRGNFDSPKGSDRAAIIAGDLKRRMQFRADDTIPPFAFVLTIGTYTLYGWDWKGVGRWQVAMVLYSLQRVPNNRFLSRSSQYVSISHVFNAWRMADHFPANSLSPLPPFLVLCTSLLLSPCAFFYACFLFSPGFRLFQFLSPSRILPRSLSSPFFSREYRDPLYFSRTTFLLLY